VRTPVFIGNFCALASQQRMLVAVELAEREELGSNILHFSRCVANQASRRSPELEATGDQCSGLL
jgi:hypothetical protein